MYSIQKSSLRARTCTYARSMSASNARVFKYHTGLLKVITCNLRGSPYCRNLGVPGHDIQW